MTLETGRHTLVVGGFGALGTAISDRLAADGNAVVRTSRTSRMNDPQVLIADPSGRFDPNSLPELDGVVWAHGINANDTVTGAERGDLTKMLDVNVTLVADTLADLDRAGRLRNGARLVVVSSIWATSARAGKFSYTVSKAALGGLVRSASIDLAPRGILVNAVLPGVVDTPMTRAMLSKEQLDRVRASTPLGRLLSPDDVSGVVAFLCSPANTAITGQSITVDLGYSVAHRL
jgi:NAD(P)-dependent dehydrogenase (short-subunit alcohol dehydrogenase family)